METCLLYIWCCHFCSKKTKWHNSHMKDKTNKVNPNASNNKTCTAILSSMLSHFLKIWFENAYICQTRHSSKLIPGGDTHFKYKEKFRWHCHNPKTAYHPFILQPGSKYLFSGALKWGSPFKFFCWSFVRFLNKTSVNTINTAPDYICRHTDILKQVRD